MNFKIVDEHGRQLAMGRNLAELRSELGGEAQALFQSVVGADHSVSQDLAEEICSWSFGELPEIMEIVRKGQTLIGHPALVDRGQSCSLEVFDDPLQAKNAHRKGLRRLFAIEMREQVRYLEKQLVGLQRVQMQCVVVDAVAKSFESFEVLRADVVSAAIEMSAMEQPWPTNEREFLERKDQARAKLTLLGLELARTLESIALELSALQRKLVAARTWPEVVKDIRTQLAALFMPHFLLEVPLSAIKHYVRYVKAINTRLDKLREEPQRDAERMAEVARLSAPYYKEVSIRKGVLDDRLVEFRWLLEELRVSLFAQELRTPMPVSVKRLTRVWESLRRL